MEAPREKNSSSPRKYKCKIVVELDNFLSVNKRTKGSFIKKVDSVKRIESDIQNKSINIFNPKVADTSKRQYDFTKSKSNNATPMKSKSSNLRLYNSPNRDLPNKVLSPKSKGNVFSPDLISKYSYEITKQEKVKSPTKPMKTDNSLITDYNSTLNSLPSSPQLNDTFSLEVISPIPHVTLYSHPLNINSVQMIDNKYINQNLFKPVVDDHNNSVNTSKTIKVKMNSDIYSLKCKIITKN